jgi:hypothetical protein
MAMNSQQYFNSLTPAQQQAATASGSGPGGPNHNAWFQAARQSGAVGAPNNEGGGGVGTAQGQSGGGNNAGIKADQIRANAKRLGLPEDYQRFDNATLEDWARRWNYNSETGKFTNKYGDQVDKPDERGPNTPKNMNGTGDQGDYGFGWNATGVGNGGPRGGGGKGGGKGGPSATNGGEFDGSYLQRGLMNLASQQGGIFRGLGADNQNAVALNSGGVFSAGDPNAQGIGAAAGALAPPAPQTAPVQGAPTPAVAPAGGGGFGTGGGGFGIGAAAGTAALSNAWAPFSTGSGAAATTPGLVSKPAAPFTSRAGSAGPAPNVAASLQAKFPNKPGAWWQS